MSWIKWWWHYLTRPEDREILKWIRDAPEAEEDIVSLLKEIQEHPIYMSAEESSLIFDNIEDLV